MREKKALTQVTARRYRTVSRLEKHRILDEFTKNTGYRRKYAIHLLANWGKAKLRLVDGKPVRFIVGHPKRSAKRRGRLLYGEPVRAAVREIWKFFDYMCGKRLAVLIRLNLALLARQPQFGIQEAVRPKLLRISPATIDRILAPERKKIALKGRNHTRPGSLLKHQIPIRTHFDWDERKPGFFELDTAAHDGGNGSGEYCVTLTATDVYSGWVELRALRNRAQRWVKEEVEAIRAHLPFPLLGVDSDNGGEFINHQLWSWCNAHHIQFTRGRSYRKNDNCFVEQKNDMAVRHAVGYYRFETEAEYRALVQVYKHLCPLLNFCYPSMKIIEKVRIGARVKKKHEAPTTPCQRLLDSAYIEAEAKANLRRRSYRIDIVKQKRLVDKAVAQLMSVYNEKAQGRLAQEEAGLEGAKCNR